MAVLKVTGRVGLTEAGFKVFEDFHWNEQRIEVVIQGILRALAYVRKF